MTGPRHRPPLYSSWIDMRRNCRESKYLAGISVCPEWSSSYGAYEAWCLENGWIPGMMVARVDKDGDYCPDNCRIVSRTEFNGMRRCVVRLEDGRRVRDAIGFGFERDRVLAGRARYRIVEAGWDIESAVGAPRMTPDQSVHIGWGARGNDRRRAGA